MNLAHKHPPRKRETIRYKPCYEEGLYIQFLLKKKKYNHARIGNRLNVTPQIVSNVVIGKRRSARIESEIARILGKESWNDVVLEARSEVQKKPVKVIKQEIEQQIQEERSAMSQAIESDAHDAIFGRDWSAHLKAYADEQAAAKSKRRRA